MFQKICAFAVGAVLGVLLYLLTAITRAAEVDTRPKNWCEKHQGMTPAERVTFLAEAHGKDRNNMIMAGFLIIPETEHCWKAFEESIDEAAVKHCSEQPVNFDAAIKIVLNAGQQAEACYAKAIAEFEKGSPEPKR